MKIIPVRIKHYLASKPMLVDDVDFEKMSEHSWCLNDNGYAVTSIQNKSTRSHRFILNAPKGLQVDHRDRNKLNNQRSNLRLCTNAENSANRGPAKKNTGFKGVRYEPERGKYLAQIKVGGVQKYLGRFSTPQEAHEVYKKATIEANGEFARWE